MELKQMITYILTDHQFQWISSNSEQPPQQYAEIIEQFRIEQQTYLDLEHCFVHIIELEASYLFIIHDKEMTTSWQFIEHVLNSVSDGLTICNSDGIIVFQNEADRKMFEVDARYLPVMEFVERGIMNESVTMKVLKSKKREDIVQTFANGHVVLVTALPIFDEAGNVEYVVANSREMTELRDMERTIERLESQSAQYKEQLEALKQQSSTSLIAVSKAMRQVIEKATRIANVDSTVLISGESGAGKEELTKLIHQLSHRAQKPMITVNCGAIPENLLESELFGYMGGAFTGANKTGKPGLFELASGGTLFLDEIGEMPLSLQVKLLRVLQESEITRVGGIKPIPVDVRIITATNRNLYDMVQRGEFREDLFYRLNIIPLRIPPLRERKEDIAPLAYRFLHLVMEKYSIERTIEEAAVDRLTQYYWPGNIRQLKNFIERVSLLTQQSTITLQYIQREFQKPEYQQHNPVPLVDDTFTQTPIYDQNQTLKNQVDAFERKVIKEALGQYPSIRQTAKALGCNQSTLVRKIQKYQLEKQVSYE